MKTNETLKPLTQGISGAPMHFVHIGLFRAVLFASIWWILTDGVIGSWVIGGPVVVVATIVSLMMLPSSSWSLPQMVHFIPYFLWQSIRGGINVARIALHPRLPVSPVLYDHSLRLPPGLSRVIMANAVNLLPGTLSVELNEEILCVHVLDKTGNYVEELILLENLILGIVGVEWPGNTTGRQI